MKISIITPAYNSARFIEKCIASVKGQTYADIEHVIVDGGSKDGTVDILKKYEKTYQLKWVSEKDKGITDAMNKGFTMATGDVFAWIDADNYYYDGIVADVVEIFKKNPIVDVVYGNIDLGVDVRHVKTYRPPRDMDFAKSLIGTTGAIPPQPGVFFKKSLFEKTGGFDLQYRVAGDYEFWVNALKQKPVMYYLDRTFGLYVIEESANSQSWKGVWDGYKEMVAIGKKYDQPLYGRIIMAIKYGRGFLVKLVR